MIADVVSRPRRDLRKGAQVNADLPAQIQQAMMSRYGPMHVPGGVIEPAATPAGQLVQIQVAAAPLAHWTLEPRTADACDRFVPHDRDRVLLDRNPGPATDEVVAYRTPSHLDLGPFGKRAVSEQRPNIDARDRLD